MPSFTPGVLVAYGCDERVTAMYLAEPDLGDDVVPARVTRVERSACFAVDADGTEQMLRARVLPAVGDWIVAARAERSVRHVLPRWSQLTRADPDGSGLQTLAANIDLVVIITPADRPSPARVERELTLAHASGGEPLVVVTKADLDLAGEVAADLGARLRGVEVHALSAATGAGLAPLRARLRPARTAVLLGPSGAGKSTLANALLGEELLATGAVRADDHRGRHTTTSRQLVAIPGGGVLIDIPGLRSLGLGGDVDLDAGFADIAELAQGCRFADCGHDDEPGCAVAQALSTGELDSDRLASYRKLAREAAFEQRRHDPLAQRAERQRFKQRTKSARAHDKRGPR